MELLARDPLLALLVGAIFVSLAIFVAFPLAAVLGKSFQNEQGALSLENYGRFARFSYLQSVLGNSVLVGLVAGGVSVFVGYAAAFTIARTNIRFKRVLHLLFILPIISPPLTSALSVLMLLGANGLITRRLLGIPDYNIYGFHGVVLSQVFTFAPVAYLTLKGVLDSLNPTLEDTAMNVGAGRWQTFRKVTLPLIAPAFFSGLVFAFVRAMTAISAAIFLVSAQWNLLTVQILNQVGSGRLGVAAAFSVILIAIVLAAIAVIGKIIPGRGGAMPAVKVAERF
jgi:iron(III) transport system permease protein